MLTITAAKEIKGTIAAPPSQDLLFLGMALALASHCRTRILDVIPCPRTNDWIDAFKTHASVTREEAGLIIEPVGNDPFKPLQLCYEDIPYRDFVVFLLLGRFGSLHVKSLPMRRFEEWRGVALRAGCRLRSESLSGMQRCILEESDKFRIPDRTIAVDDIHPFLGLAMGLRVPFGGTIDSPFVSPLRHVLPCFGYECQVQSLSQKKNEDPLVRRMRFMMTGKKSEGPPQFKMTVDFSKTPTEQTRLTVPGDDAFSSLILVAKCLIPRGSLLLENVGLETWNTQILQLLKNMGAALGIQETHQSSFGSVGSVVVQKINPFGRKVDCRPRYQFASQLPAMLVMAAFSQGQSVFRNLEDLRNDEPDGIEQLNSCISTLGVRYGEMPDGIVIEGAKEFDGFDLQKPLPGPIAGAFAVAGLKCRGTTTIADDHILRQWPDFKQSLWSIVEFKE